MNDHEFIYENFETQQRIIKEYAMIVGAMTYERRNLERIIKNLLDKIEELEQGFMYDIFTKRQDN